jgi:hypothetical protein
MSRAGLTPRAGEPSALSGELAKLRPTPTAKRQGAHDLGQSQSPSVRITAGRGTVADPATQSWRRGESNPIAGKDLTG